MSFIASIKHKLAAHPGLQLLLLFVLLFLLAWPSITSLLFFISDTGLRYLQIQELIDHGWRTFAIDYPGRPFDPELRHVPYYTAYIVVGGKLHLSITPFFPLLASFLFAGIGKTGLVFLPVLGAALTAAASYRLACLGRLRHPYLLLWGAVFFTPILFYSLELWDHTLAVALALWGVAFVVEGVQQEAGWLLLLGGILAGLAIGQRGELIVFAPALALGLLLVTSYSPRAPLIYAIGGLLGMVPVGMLNFLAVGHPLGVTLARRLSGYGEPDYYGVTPTLPAVEGAQEWLMLRAAHLGRFLFHLDPTDPLTATATMVALLSILLVVVALRLQRYRTARIFALGLALAVLSYGLWLVRGLEISLVGLITSFPLIAFSLAFVDAGDEVEPLHQPYKLMTVTAWAFVFLSLLLTFLGYGTHGGAQWGARYLLPVYPLLLYLAVFTYEVNRDRAAAPTRRALTVTFAGLLLLALAFQLMGARLLLYGKRTHRQTLHDLVASLPVEVILTNSAQIPALSTAQDDKIFLWVNDDEGIRTLAQRMARQGVERFAVLARGDETGLKVPPRAGEFTIRQIEPFVYALESSAAAEP